MTHAAAFLRGMATLVVVLAQELSRSLHIRTVRAWHAFTQETP